MITLARRLDRVGPFVAELGVAPVVDSLDGPLDLLGARNLHDGFLRPTLRGSATDGFFSYTGEGSLIVDTDALEPSDLGFRVDSTGNVHADGMYHVGIHSTEPDLIMCVALGRANPRIEPRACGGGGTLFVRGAGSPASACCNSQEGFP